MPNFVEDFPHYGTQEEKDLFIQRFVNNYNESQRTGGPGGGGTLTSGLMVNNNNEVVDTNNPTERLGYRHRRLHIRITSDANNENLVDPDEYTGSEIYVNVFNSDDETIASADNNYINIRFDWTGGNLLYIIPFGFNNARIERHTEVQVGRTGLVTPTFVFDLEEGVGVGATGPSGAPAIVTQVTIRDTAQIDLTTDPSSWPIEDDGQFFRNNMGDGKTLLATVLIGGIEQNFATHNTYTYRWTKNGQTFTPTVTGQTLTRRYLQIAATDVEDGGADQFLCTVTTPD